MGCLAGKLVIYFQRNSEQGLLPISWKDALGYDKGQLIPFLSLQPCKCSRFCRPTSWALGTTTAADAAPESISTYWRCTKLFNLRYYALLETIYSRIVWSVKPFLFFTNVREHHFSIFTTCLTLEASIMLLLTGSCNGDWCGYFATVHAVLFSCSSKAHPYNY